MTENGKRFVENGARIRRARERLQSTRPAINHRPDRPISQDDFAALVGTTRRNLMRLEGGITRPKGPLRDRIVEVTGTKEQIEAADDEDEEDLFAQLLSELKWAGSPEISYRDLHGHADEQDLRTLRLSALRTLSKAAQIARELA
jgi:transcriptional regulator with XRE-family HTH domain